MPCEAALCKLAAPFANGGDPLGELEMKRAEPSIEQLVERFITESLPRRAERTRAEYVAMLKGFILPALGNQLGKQKVSAVGRMDLEQLHAKLTQERGPRRQCDTDRGSRLIRIRDLREAAS